MSPLSEAELANLDKTIFKNRELMRMEIQHRGAPLEETMLKLQLAQKLKREKDEADRKAS